MAETRRKFDQDFKARRARCGWSRRPGSRSRRWPGSWGAACGQSPPHDASSWTAQLDRCSIGKCGKMIRTVVPPGSGTVEDNSHPDQSVWGESSLHQTRGAPRRTVTIPPHVVPVLAEHMEMWAGPERVFVGRDGRPMRGARRSTVPGARWACLGSGSTTCVTRARRSRLLQARR
jgi:hypothetical protein